MRAFARSIGAKAKTDPVDAAVIARYLATVADDLAPWRPDPDTEHLSALVRFRARLVGRAAVIRARHGRDAEPLIRRILAEQLAALKGQIAELEAAIRAAIADEPAFAERTRLLESAPGVGSVLSASLIAELPEPGTTSGRRIASPVGVAPFDRRSGTRHHPSHCTGGRNRLADRYRAPIAHGKATKVAIVAVMRILLVALNAMVRHGTAWAG